MKTKAKKAAPPTPRPTPTNTPSEGTSARFKAIVAAGRGKKKGDAPPDAEAPTAAVPASAVETVAASPAATPVAFPGQVTPEELAPRQGFKTLRDLGAAWIEHLKAKDAAVSTWASYMADFETAATYFGADADPASLTVAGVAAYEKSDAVMQTKKGRPKAPPTIYKTRRVLRLALTWARDERRLATIPYPSAAGCPDAKAPATATPRASKT